MSVFAGPLPLVDAVQAVRQHPTGVLFAKPPLSWGAEALVAQLNDDYSVPSELAAQGFVCLLDHEDVSMVLGSSTASTLPPRVQAELVVHYAVYDAFPEWLELLALRWPNNSLQRP